MKTMMKFAAALGLMVAGLGVSTAASAQNHDNRGYSSHHRDDRRHDWRDGRRGYTAHYRGHRNGWGHRACRTEWRHHRRVTVCYR